MVGMFIPGKLENTNRQEPSPTTSTKHLPAHYWFVDFLLIPSNFLYAQKLTLCDINGK